MASEESENRRLFAVYVDDNFHYTDEGERYKHGSFETLELAIAACKRFVEGEVSYMYKAGMSSEELYSLYQSFGEDPFVRGSTDGVPFSAWNYAKEFADKICAAGSLGQVPNNIG